MEINLSNRRISPQEAIFATALAQERFNIGKTSLPGEIIKSAEELELIAKVNQVYKQEFTQLGIEGLFVKIDQLAVHFLSGTVYKSLYPNAKGTAFQTDLEGAIVLNKDSQDIIFQYLHEAAHAYAYHSYFFDANKNSVKLKWSGFQVETSSQKIPSAFNGLNEAVCDMIANGVQHKNFQLFYGKSSTPKNTRYLQATYPEEIDILDTVITGIANKSGISFYEVWQDIRKAFFTGNLDIMRSVDLTFGKSSLKKLATLGLERINDNETIDEQLRHRDKIKKHFLEI